MVNRRVAFGLGITALALAACQVIVGIEQVEKVPQGSVGEDGSSSSGSTTTSSGSSGIDENDPCQHTVAPKVAGDDGGEDLEPFFIAVQKLSLVKPAPNGIGGLDLDDSCTCDTRPGGTHDAGPSCTARKGIVCDPDGGADNQGATLFAGLESSVKLVDPTFSLDDDLNEDIAKGARTIILHVRKWNGKPNDANVEVALFVSQGAKGTLNWDGNDVWTHPKSLSETGTFKFPGSVNGYVANNRLVVKGANNVTILFGRAGLVFNEAIVYGDLTIAEGLPRFVGIVGGRVPDAELLAAAGQINVGGDESACENALVFNTVVKPSICDAVDINSAKSEDFQGKACDSISSSIALEGVGAQVPISEPYDDPKPPGPCSPGQPTAPSYKCD
ncbi:MAG: hypothetical protein KIT84_40575 [Labilithrix sp.]|nr:hypothetical protein [Labilithrix sp.]MCW5817364.1 hypothetical protein [Labilithrix sp.]